MIAKPEKPWRKRRGIVALEYLAIAAVVMVPNGYFADDYIVSMRRQSAELSAGIESLNHGYSVPTQRGCGAVKPGSVYRDGGVLSQGYASPRTCQPSRFQRPDRGDIDEQYFSIHACN